MALHINTACDVNNKQFSPISVFSENSLTVQKCWRVLCTNALAGSWIPNETNASVMPYY